jgi:hypothetical protein
MRLVGSLFSPSCVNVELPMLMLKFGVWVAARVEALGGRG